MKRLYRLLLILIVLTVLFTACTPLSSTINATTTSSTREITSSNSTSSERSGQSTTASTPTSNSASETTTNISSTEPNTSSTNGSNSEPPLSTQAAFEKKQYSASGVTINYWLYTPQNATENMPLIVYLHGGSGKGDDLELITAVDGFPQYLRDNKLAPNAYVIIPQVSSSYKGWGEMKTEVIRLISFVTDTYKIDSNRISLTGHSMGGTGAWMLALAYPNTFSAVAPLSGSVTLSDTNINKLKNVPVWAIVGTADTVVAPASSVNFITELSKYNSNARLTELNGADHFAVPNLSYLSKDFDLITWLISHAKTE